MMSKKISNASHKNYITDDSLHEIKYARDQAFSFVPMEDIWLLGVLSDEKIDVSELHLSASDCKLEYLTLLVHFAEIRSPGTVKKHYSALRISGFTSNFKDFQQLWPRLTTTLQSSFKTLYRLAVEDYCWQRFEEFYEFTQRTSIQLKRQHLDLYKGAYTDDENDSISYAFRVATVQILKEYQDTQQIITPRQVSILGSFVALHLNRGIVRRSSQLVQLKWADIRPSGMGFGDSLQVPKLVDHESLHIRIFKGKRGDFRGFAEKRSLLLSPELSNLIALYYHHYMQTLEEKWLGQGIVLSQSQLPEVRNMLPVFCGITIFSTEFNTVSQLLQAFSMKSKAFHKTADNLSAVMFYSQKEYLRKNLRSDRMDKSKFNVSNNRIRHTIMTNGARKNMDGAQLAAITGVTTDTVKIYVDLSHDARVEIDEHLSSNKVLNGFGRIPVTDTKDEIGFVQLNEFEEEIGIISDETHCVGCSSKMGKPLGCYPCPNFKPLVDADHGHYLVIAERKLSINQSSNNSLVTQKLNKCVRFIQATIKACDEYRMKKIRNRQ